MNKLNRLLRYLNRTKGLGILIETDDEFHLLAFIDASFGINYDGKGHTGLIITFGKGPVFLGSWKQRLVTKSSTEAELVGMSECQGNKN